MGKLQLLDVDNRDFSQMLTLKKPVEVTHAQTYLTAYLFCHNVLISTANREMKRTGLPNGIIIATDFIGQAECLDETKPPLRFRDEDSWRNK
jgi:hypothetical protein